MINNCTNGTSSPDLLFQSSKFIYVILACLIVSPVQADDCIKQVFNRYCLGGNVEKTLSQIKPAPESQSLKNNQTQYYFKDNDKTLNIIAAEGVIQKVIRQERPGGWINYTAWKVKLIRLYGKGKDLSNFPAYATSRSSRLNAINAGRGSAEYQWDQEGYTIAITWDHPEYIELQYVLKQDDNPIQQNSEGL